MNRCALAFLIIATFAAAQEKKPAEEEKPAQEAKPAEETKAAEEAKPAEEAAAESPTPVREKRFTSTIDVGYRFLTDVQGDLNTYRSLVNLGEGPKLLGWTLELNDPSRKVFDRLSASAHNWGGDPYNTLRVDAERQGSYRFTADYRNIKYFNSLPSFANPRIEQNVFLSQRAYDMGRRIADVSLELFPGSRLIPYLEYAHDSGSGTGVTPFVTNGNEFPVATNLRDRTNHFRGGVRFERDRYHVTLEQGGSAFKDDQRVWTRDHNTGNRPGPIAGTSTYLDDLEQAYGVRGTSIYSKALMSARPADWFTLTGQFLFSQPEIDTNYTENARGLFYLGATQFYPGQDLMTVSMAKQPHTSGGVGAEVHLGSRVRVLESWTTDRFHNAASAVLTGQLLLGGNATMPVNQAFSAPLVVNYNRQQVDALFDVTKKLTLRGGHRYVWGDALVRAPGLSHTGQPTAGELSQHVGLAGAQFKATANTTVNVDYEGASTSEAYFRTSLRDYQQVRVRARHQLPGSVLLGVNFRFLDNQSPEASGGYKFRDMDTSVSLLWTPQNGKRMSLAGEYSRTALNSDLTFLIPQSLQPARSFYRDNGHTAGAMLDLVLPPVKGRAPRFSLGGTLFVSSGSRPTDYYQPVIGFRVPVAERVEIFTDWRWYGYSQTFYLYEGFRSHQVLAGLRWTM